MLEKSKHPRKNLQQRKRNTMPFVVYKHLCKQEEPARVWSLEAVQELKRHVEKGKVNASKLLSQCRDVGLQECLKCFFQCVHQYKLEKTAYLFVS